ncbi:hypothetical protein L3X38_006057 [Prunus dulcis]|uniref:Wall-associated receptor kinase galacturonan-binding domain-containing protein n=1 Tax=Prunus dulcis TaxID=3755 RepID=A0AAD5F4Q8_PRUDU|nr:hypothetical protein L3X38_006057 [Prunus dulcis]
MKSWLRHCLFVFSLPTHLVVLHSTEEGELYNKRCPSILCNEIVGHIQLPLKNKTHPPECGGLFTVDCSDHNHLKIQLKEEGYWHEFASWTLPNTIYIKDTELQQRLERDPCNYQVFEDWSLPRPSPIFDELFTHNLTLFKCNTPFHKDLKYHCKNDSHTYYAISCDDI